MMSNQQTLTNATVNLPDTLNADNANTVLQTIVAACSTKTPMTVNLSVVKHCDSAGLAALIAAKSQCQEKHSTLTFTNASPQLTALADFLKVSEWFSS